MPELLGGGAGGFQAFQQYDQSAQLFEQTKQENALKIEEEGIAVQKSKIELDSQQKMMALMEQHAKQKQMTPGSPPPPEDPTLARVNQLNDYADLYLAAGMPEKAKELITASSTIANQHSEIVTRQTSDDKAKWGTVANLLEGVHDQKSWQQAQFLFQQMHPDWASTPDSQKIFSTQYSPEFIDAIKQTANTQLETADLKAKQAAALASTAAMKQNEARAKEDEAAARNYDSIRVARDKAGGKTLAPSSTDVKTITDLMKEDYGDPADQEETSRFNNRAVGVAERMKDLMRQGVPKSTASVQAYQEAKQRGSFGGLRKAKEPPGSFGKPLAMPGAPGDLKDNMYYLGKGGQIARWDATTKKFILPEANVPAGGGGAEDDDRDDDDDSGNDTPAQ